MLLLVVIACKKENNPLNKFKEAKQSIKNVNEMVNGVKNYEKNMEDLSKLTPITKEKIKSWMPKELNDLKRTSFNISNQMGVSLFKLVFKDENGKKINITITDGAGNAAPMMAMYTMVQNMEIDKEDENGYERTQKFGKQPVLIKYHKSNNYEKSTLQALINGRFGMEANAWKMTPEKLWEYIEKLKIEKLIN